MDRFEERARSRTDAETLWAVLTDPDRIVEWLTIASDVEVDGDTGLGQRLHITGGHLGVRRTIPTEVDRYEPTTGYGWASDDPLRLRFRYDLEPADDQVTLRAGVEVDLAGLPRIATRLAVRSLRTEFRRSVGRLCDLAAGPG